MHAGSALFRDPHNFNPTIRHGARVVLPKDREQPLLFEE